jgi:hypothetical protein
MLKEYRNRFIYINMFCCLWFAEGQFDKYMEGERRVRRDTPTPDTRVHACLYFIAPTGIFLLHSRRQYTVKRLLTLTKLSLAGKNLIIPGQGEFGK